MGLASYVCVPSVYVQMLGTWLYCFLMKLLLVSLIAAEVLGAVSVVSSHDSHEFLGAPSG